LEWSLILILSARLAGNNFNSVKGDSSLGKINHMPSIKLEDQQFIHKLANKWQSTLTILKVLVVLPTPIQHLVLMHQE